MMIEPWLKWLGLALGVLAVIGLRAAAYGSWRWGQGTQALLTQLEAAQMLFRFQEDGLIDTVRAEARGRLMGGKTVSAPWQGHFWNYAMKDGMQVPMQSEIAWILPEGTWPYFRGTTTALSYEFAK